MLSIRRLSDKAYGINTYELRINSQLICTFNHRYEDGLAACLLRASEAVTKARQAELEVFLQHLCERTKDV